MIEKLKKVDNSEFPYLDEGGTSHRSKKSFLQTTILGFCGCGDPDSVMVYVRDLLKEINSQVWEKDESDLPYMFFVYWANDKGFAEHGITARCSWLTDKGKEVLADIEWCLENEKD